MASNIVVVIVMEIPCCYLAMLTTFYCGFLKLKKA